MNSVITPKLARLMPHYFRTYWTEIMEFDWWVIIDVDYIISEVILIFNLVNLFTAQKRLEFGPQLPNIISISEQYTDHH